jgi:hypothetical protein
VEGEEGAPFGGAMRQRKKHVGDEAGFLLHFEDANADVLRQVFQFRYGVAADRWRGHDFFLAIGVVSGYFMSPSLRAEAVTPTYSFSCGHTGGIIDGGTSFNGGIFGQTGDPMKIQDRAVALYTAFSTLCVRKL